MGTEINNINKVTMSKPVTTFSGKNQGINNPENTELQTLSGAGYAYPSKPLTSYKVINKTESGLKIIEGSNNKQGLLAPNDTIILPPIYDKVDPGISFSNELAPVEFTLNNKTGIAVPPENPDGNWSIIPPQYNSVTKSMTADNYTVTKDNGKTQIINKEGKALSEEYDKILGYSGTNIFVRNGDKYGIIDSTTGKELLPAKYSNFVGLSRPTVITDNTSGQQGLMTIINEKPLMLIEPGIYKGIEDFNQTGDLSYDPKKTSRTIISPVNGINSSRNIGKAFLAQNKDDTKSLLVYDVNSNKLNTIIESGKYVNIECLTNENKDFLVNSGYIKVTTKEGKVGLGKVENDQFSLVHQPEYSDFKYTIFQRAGKNGQVSYQENIQPIQ